MRNFIITILSKNSKGEVVSNLFDYHNEQYPSHYKIVQVSKQIYKGNTNISLMAITELNDKDFSRFISEQEEGNR